MRLGLEKTHVRASLFGAKYICIYFLSFFLRLKFTFWKTNILELADTSIPSLSVLTFTVNKYWRYHFLITECSTSNVCFISKRKMKYNFCTLSYSYIIHEYSATVVSYNMLLSMMNRKKNLVEPYIARIVLTELQHIGSKTLRLVKESISTPFLIKATPSGVTCNVASPRHKQLVPHY